jgi:ATP-binding cassette subfamily F protein 3
MLELTADRLVLVDNGTATEFSGSIDDYTDFVLGRGGNGGTVSSSGQPVSKGDRKAEKRAAAQAREQSKSLRDAVAAAEKEMATLTTRRSQIERAMFDPASAEPADKPLAMGDLMKRRGEVEKKLEEAEARWLEATERLEAAGV